MRVVKLGLSPQPMTLAIGDGANDVGMIKAASVGIGISGREGQQAANASDYSISQFCFLKRLLFIHGYWDTVRMAKVVQYSFYKNMVLTLCLFYNSFWTGFSGTALFESLIYSGFNFFLGLPIIGVGIFDRDVPQEVLLARPQIYAAARHSEAFTPKTMARWVLEAIIHSAIVFIVPTAIQWASNGVWCANGEGDGLMYFGLVVYTSLIMAMHTTAGRITKTWTTISHVLIWGSVIGYFAFVWGYSSLSLSQEFFGVGSHVFSAVLTYVVVALVTSLVICTDACARIIASLAGGLAGQD